MEEGGEDMQPFVVPWSFFMTFDYEKNQLVIHFSEEIRRQHQIDSESITLFGDDIRDYIHKYDYRKLIYFSQNPLVQPFDTILRFQLPQIKGHIRTQAICKSHVKGFNCLMIEDRFFHKLKPLWQLEDQKNRKILFMDEMLHSLENDTELNLFRTHLSYMLSKAQM